ncbi:gag-pol polyprotein [Tanacetum coccineum]
MSNSNTNLQTQSSNALYNAIMEAGSKDRPPMYMKNYKNVSQDIRDQLNAEAEAVQIILTGIDNDIYSTVDACPNACEMWKVVERLKQGESINVQDLETNLYWEFRKFTSRDGESLELYYSRFYKMMNDLSEISVMLLIIKSQQSTRNRGKAIVTSYAPTYDPEPATVTKDDEMSKEKKIDKLMALISLSLNRGTGYDNQRAINVAGARENVGTLVVHKSGIQCYNCKEYGHVSRECQKPKRVKDAAYHKEKMLLCKQEEARVLLNAEQADWKDDTDDESEDQELEAHYMTIQPIAVPISTREPKHNVNQSVATSSKKTVATDSTVKKSRNITRKLYEQVSKTCSWWYPKYTPPGYNWKPKSQIGNVNPKVSMHLRNASRTANILEPMTPRCSTISNTPLSSNSFAARRDNSIHRRLWVLKAHDRKSQTSN